MEISILGPLTVVRDGADLEVGGPKPRGLLALLALYPASTLSTDRIVDVLWGDTAPRQITGTLQAYVSTIRRVLEPARPPRAPATILVTSGDGYRLDVPPEAVDAGRFEAHAAAARRALRDDEADAALAAADAALALWRGRPVPELADAAAVVGERVRLEELRTGVREDRAEAALRAGLHVVGDLEVLVADDRLRERPWRLLMEALGREGRVADALDRYRQYRDVLDEELGLEPSRAMQDLQRRLLAGEGAGSTTVADVTATVPTRPTVAVAVPARHTLVGRVRERGRLDQQLRARDAGARWILVAGEAGIGKTTLVGYLADRARAHRRRVAWARCPEEADAPPYWPVTQWLGELGLAPLGDLGDALPALDDRARTFRLFEAVADRLERAASAAPLLLVIDDLQWADAATVRLLSHLAGRLASSPLLVAATLRSEEVGRDPERLLATLAREVFVERIDVGPMGAEELRELADLHGRVLAEGELALLATRSSGNPFFATELLRLPDDERAAGPGHAGVPAGVREVVRRRLERSGPDVVDVLTIAAGIGLEFDLPLLLAASGLHQDELLDRLDHALAARLLEEGVGGRLRFVHALVLDTLADELTVLGRQRLHARLADALERLPARDGRIGELARHRLASVPISGARTAVETALAAARHAVRELAHDQAVVWLTAALELAGTEVELSRDRELRYALQLERGRALLISGAAAEGWDALSAAFDLAEEAGRPLEMAAAVNAYRIASGSWNWVPFGVRPVALLRRIEAALEVLPPGRTRERVELLVTLAEGSYFVDPHRAAGVAAEAVELARRAGDDDDLAEALVGQLVCTFGTEDPATQLARLDALEELPGERPPPHRAHTTLHRWRALTELGRRDEADGALAEASRAAGELPLPAFRAEVGWARLTHRILRVDLVGIEDELERVAGVHARSGLYAAREFRATQLLLLRWWQGRIGECEPLLRTDLADVGPGGVEFRALVLLAGGRAAQARTLLAGSVPPVPADWTGVTVACLRAWVAARADVPARAEEALASLDPRRTQIAVFGTGATVGPVGLYTGVARAVLGDVDGAERDLRVAVAHADRGVGGPWGILARLELADLLVRSGDAGPEADGLVAHARREAAASGSPELERVVRQRQRTRDNGRGT